MWIWIIAGAGLLAAATMWAPKPQTQPPAGLGDFDVPTAEDGREIPVVFGTINVKSPNVTWFGHFKSIAVRKKGGKK